MKYKLYNVPSPQFSAREQVLYNRGITLDKQKQWLNANHEHIVSWTMLDYDKIKRAVYMLADTIQQNQRIAIIVD